MLCQYKGAIREYKSPASPAKQLRTNFSFTEDYLLTYCVRDIVHISSACTLNYWRNYERNKPFIKNSNSLHVSIIFNVQAEGCFHIFSKLTKKATTL